MVDVHLARRGITDPSVLAAAVLMGRAWWKLAPEIFGTRMPLTGFLLLVLFVAWVWVWFAIVVVKCEGSLRTCGAWRLALDVDPVSGAEVEAHGTAPEQPLAPVDLFELEYRPRPAARGACALHERIGEMLLKPSSAAARTPAHDFSRPLADISSS